MATYRLRRFPAYRPPSPGLAPQFLRPGATIVVEDGTPPAPGWEPLDDAARAAVEARPFKILRNGLQAADTHTDRVRVRATTGDLK